MRSSVLFFLFLFPTILWAQDFVIKGSVIDYTIKEPITNGIVMLYYEDYNAGDTVRELML